jgi:hypothetical protein
MITDSAFVRSKRTMIQGSKPYEYGTSTNAQVRLNQTTEGVVARCGGGRSVPNSTRQGGSAGQHEN